MESSGDKASSKTNSKILPALCHLGAKQGSQHSSLQIYFCKRRRADKIVCLASSNKAFCSASSAAPRSLREERSRDLPFLLKATRFFLQAWASGAGHQARLLQALSLQQLRQHQLLPIQEAQNVAVHQRHCKILIASVSAFSCYCT